MVKYDEELEQRLLAGEAVPFPYCHNLFHKTFTDRTKRKLYKVTPDFGLSLRSGVKGTHWAMLEYLDDDDVALVEDLPSKQLEGFAVYVAAVIKDFGRAFVDGRVGKKGTGT